MRPIFTDHASEYLLGRHIEKMFKSLNVWVPSKDMGVDLLVTGTSNKRASKECACRSIDEVALRGSTME